MALHSFDSAVNLTFSDLSFHGFQMIKQKHYNAPSSGP